MLLKPTGSLVLKVFADFSTVPKGNVTVSIYRCHFGL